MNSHKIILDLCSGSGAWSKPYQENGFKVITIDLINATITKDISLVTIGDIARQLDKNDFIFGILAAPPCDNFSLLSNFKEVSDNDMITSLRVVDACLRFVYLYKPYFWVLENPVGYLKQYLGEPKLIFHPYEYGNGYTKRTSLWGKFRIPKKQPVEIEKRQYITRLYHYDKEERKRIRAITPSGFAQAFYDYNH